MIPPPEGPGKQAGATPVPRHTRGVSVLAILVGMLAGVGAFTLQNFHEPIRITERNARILQSSCIDCHRDFVHNLLEGSTTDPDAVRCVHCHQSVGHGEKVGLGGPERSTEKGASEL